MARLLLAIAVTVSMLMPVAAGAREAPVSGSSKAEVFVLSAEGVLIIAAGAAVGALLVHVATPGEFGALAGGLLGGVAANWWYRHGGKERVRALLRAPVGMEQDGLRPQQPRLLRVVLLRR